MATKRGSRSGKQHGTPRVRNVRARTLGADKAKNVRGGQGDLKKGGSTSGGGGKLP